MKTRYIHNLHIWHFRRHSHIYFFLRDKYILSALDVQSLKFSKVRSVKSAIFNSLFTTGQKINIAVLRSLSDVYSNIRALTMLSRCSLELSMGVYYITLSTNTMCDGFSFLLLQSCSSSIHLFNFTSIMSMST